MVETPMGDNGFDSPESAAMVGFPPKYCRPIASRMNGDDAYVLLNTGSSEQPYLYGVNCRLENGRWFEGGSSNGPGWEQTGHDPDLETLSFWDDAPVDADMVRVEFDGSIVEEPVIDRAFLVVWGACPHRRTGLERWRSESPDAGLILATFTVGNLPAPGAA